MIRDFGTWAPLLRLVRFDSTGRASGQIGRGSWSVPVPRPEPVPGRAMQVDDMRDEWDAVQRLRKALVDSGVESVSFVVEKPAPGRVVLHLIESRRSVEDGLGPYPGSILLVDGAVAEPRRRLPEPSPQATPAPTADLALLERALRERLPEATGATEAEIAAAEARLGVTLPDELRTLYRVIGAAPQGEYDFEQSMRIAEATGVDLYPLDELSLADVASRPCPWQFAATQAVTTAPDAAVQQLAGSPGWIAFGGNYGGDTFAVDLTPGPAGHTGQIIFISHEEYIGAGVYADSLTDLVLNRRSTRPSGPRADQTPLVAHVNIRSLPSIEAAADPLLEVLQIGVWDGAPLSLEPVLGLPRLRTLTAYPGTLADPLQIAGLTGLEFLRLGPAEWRVLLDAGAVPRGLLAAGIEVMGSPDPLAVNALANELLALFGCELITETILEGSPDGS